MRYENRQPAEGINVSHEHPLRQWLRLVIAAAVLLAITVAVLQVSGAWLARRIPFSAEQRLFQSSGIRFDDAATPAALQNYLDELAAGLGAHMPLPEGMEFDLHYLAGPDFNAYATLGGHLSLYRGLLAKLPHENALAMVVAHEMAHVLHRDSIAGLGGGLASVAALMVVTGNAGSAGEFLGWSGTLQRLSFNRTMESRADAAAVAALAGYYGHLGGADDLFRLFSQTRRDGSSPRWLDRFLSTHPLNADRGEQIVVEAQRAGVPVSGATTPLPAAFHDWLAATSDDRAGP